MRPSLASWIHALQCSGGPSSAQRYRASSGAGRSWASRKTRPRARPPWPRAPAACHTAPAIAHRAPSRAAAASRRPARRTIRALRTRRASARATQTPRCLTQCEVDHPPGNSSEGRRSPLASSRNARPVRPDLRRAPHGVTPNSPNLNAYAERFVRSIKQECLRHIVPLGERHLRAVVREFVEHYHAERNHQGLGNVIPFPSRDSASPIGRIGRRERLGGLLSFYEFYERNAARIRRDRELEQYGVRFPSPAPNVAAASGMNVRSLRLCAGVSSACPGVKKTTGLSALAAGGPLL
jgi:transposase InsO family protein